MTERATVGSAGGASPTALGSKSLVAPTPPPASPAPFWCPGDRVSDHLLRTVVVMCDHPERTGWVLVRVVGRTIARNDQGRPAAWYEAVMAADLRPLGTVTGEVG